VAPSSGNYSIKIKKYNTSQAKTSLQLFATSSLLRNNKEEFSLGMLASCPQVITVGAVDAITLKLQSYSSNGPALDGRMKPDLVAPDNVSTAAYFPDKFNGSSASAPFVAAAIALALEKGRKIGYTDDETVKFLLESALDLGPKGHDTGYGRGLINLKRFAMM
jgi:subtilisin family serine protease